MVHDITLGWCLGFGFVFVCLAGGEITMENEEIDEAVEVTAHGRVICQFVSVIECRGFIMFSS